LVNPFLGSELGSTGTFVAVAFLGSGWGQPTPRSQVVSFLPPGLSSSGLQSSISTPQPCACTGSVASRGVVGRTGCSIREVVRGPLVHPGLEADVIGMLPSAGRRGTDVGKQAGQGRLLPGVGADRSLPECRKREPRSSLNAPTILRVASTTAARASNAPASAAS